MARAQLNRARLQRWLKRMAGKRVGVIGDSMLDAFLWGDATRISPEAPVPVVLVTRQTLSLGGAANVAANVAALGGRPLLFSAVGADRAGARLARLLETDGIESGALLALAARPTTVKHRVFARNKHLLRFDHERAEPLPPEAERLLLAALQRAAATLDAVIVSDYAKGCITPALARGVARICKRHCLPWCVDPKRADIRHGATVLKPNLAELALLAGASLRTDADVRAAAARVLRRQRCQHLLVTRGHQGMWLFGADGSDHRLNSSGHAVADVTGAGDTVNAALGLGLAAGLTPAQAAAVANLAGSFVVSLPGTAVARAQDLLAML
ncbi:MAG: bifunctional heptose 7-phosphate kinase/heptose 1-phosphate adenyltransferase [Terriglobales bacterium]